MVTVSKRARIWGIRITAVTEARSEALKKTSGIVVVIHKRGKKAEKPHYHIFYDNGIEESHTKVLERLRKNWLTVFSEEIKGPLFELSSKENYSLEGFWHYALDPMKSYRQAELLCWNIPEIEQLPIPALPEVVSDVISHVGSDDSAGVREYNHRKHYTVREKMEMFYQECVRPHYFEKTEEYSRRQIAKLLFHRWKGGEDKKYNAVRYIDFALYRLYEDAGESRKSQFMDYEADWVEQVLSLR